MKRILILSLLIIGFGLYNFKIIDFKNGFRVASFGSSLSLNATVIDQLSYLRDIQNVYFYDNPVGRGYVIVMDSATYGIELEVVNKEAIEFLRGASLVSDRLTPKKITTIPLVLYSVALLIVVIIPDSKKYD